MYNKTQQTINRIHLQHNSTLIYSCKNVLKVSFKAVFNILNSVRGHYTFN